MQNRFLQRSFDEVIIQRRTRHSQEILADLEERYGVAVLGEPIPKSVRFAEAPGRGRSILTHAPRSAGAEAYRAIARILHQENK